MLIPIAALVLALTPEQQLESALQRALMRSPARVQLISWQAPRCTGTLVPAPFENSGRVAVRVRGRSCEAWGWAIVKVIVPLATLTRDVRPGEALDGAFTLTDGESTAGPFEVPPGAQATRLLRRGATVREEDVAFGPRPGTSITVRVLAGSLSIEQRAITTHCGAELAARTVCASLPTGKRVAGVWSDGVLTVGAP